MERLLVIICAAAIGIGFYYWFSRMINKDSMRRYIMSHLWLLHPNAICYWRAAMALVGYFLYFFSTHQSIAIFIFTFAAILDGVDGIVARNCNLGSKLGRMARPDVRQADLSAATGRLRLSGDNVDGAGLDSGGG